jgi:hypothetical protein
LIASQQAVFSWSTMNRVGLDYLCLLLEVDLIEHIVVAMIKVIPHSFIRSKAFMIFASLSLALEAIPDVAVAIGNP